jgi:hypothetical protein
MLLRAANCEQQSLRLAGMRNKKHPFIAASALY